MDMSYLVGNCVQIHTPPGQVIETPIQLCAYLLHNQDARTKILEMAEASRQVSWQAVWVYHPYLLYPLLLSPSTTDDYLTEAINVQLSACAHSTEEPILSPEQIAEYFA